MIDSTRSGAVVDECAAGAAELMVESDCGGQAEKPLQDALAQASECAGAVALEGENVLADPEDRLDPLADRRQVWPSAGLVLAARAHDGRLQLGHGCGELASGIALVADERLAAVALAASEQPQRDLALIALGRGQRECSGRAVEGKDGVQAKAPEVAAVAAAVAVVGGVGQGRALDGLAASGALHRGGVDEQQIIV